MSLAATNHPELRGGQALNTRAALTAFLAGRSHDVGADAYLLFVTAYREGEAQARVVASNWSYDLVELAGPKALARFGARAVAAPPGARAIPIDCLGEQTKDHSISEADRYLLGMSGHAEIYSLAVQAGRQCYYLLLSAKEPGTISADQLGRLQLEASYALSRSSDLLAETAPDRALSARERECLIWVGEGKTTDDVSTILGVSSATVNSYLTSAMQRLSASNRAMGVASAIRSGLI